ncbi:MAG: AAA family ATPase [Candidatus Nanoarchaeia archaeon]|nr:AAA family ATPase [Candidatus Nanoarchaeia archaeon]
MVIIYVTGTPGVGKTTFSKNLELALKNQSFENLNYTMKKYSFENEKENKLKKININEILQMLNKNFSFNEVENIDLTTFIKNNSISNEFDEENDCLIVDLKILKRKLLNYMNNNNNNTNNNESKNYNNKLYIIDSHMTPNLEIKPDFQIIIRKEINKLRKELEKRNYSQHKINDNIECEIFEVNLIDSLENYPNVKTIELHVD